MKSVWMKAVTDNEGNISIFVFLFAKWEKLKILKNFSFFGNVCEIQGTY